MHNQCILASEFRLKANPEKKKKDYSLNTHSYFGIAWQWYSKCRKSGGNLFVLNALL